MQDQLQELEFRLEVVALAVEVGVDEAARIIAERWPEREIGADTIRAWVQDYERVNSLDLASLRLSDEGKN